MVPPEPSAIVATPSLPVLGTTETGAGGVFGVSQSFALVCTPGISGQTSVIGGTQSGESDGRLASYLHGSKQ